MRSFREDYANGKQNESSLKPILEQFFECEVYETPKTFPMDFYTKSAFIEIKSRNVTSTMYPTTMLPYSKIEFAQNSKRDIYFFFKFTDKTGYIKFDRELFNQFHTEVFQRQARVDHIDKKQIYIYIPISSLSEIVPQGLLPEFEVENT